MKLFYKILATFFWVQAAFSASGLDPQYIMQLKQQGMQQQAFQQSSMMPHAGQWAAQAQQTQMPSMQWPMMMSRPMQNFGQAPQMGGFGTGPQWMNSGFMGQNQSLRVPAGAGAAMGLSPQIQNQSRMPAGGGSFMPPQQGMFQHPPMQRRGGTQR